jgi:hypothetical protein
MGPEKVNLIEANNRKRLDLQANMNKQRLHFVRGA